MPWTTTPKLLGQDLIPDTTGVLYTVPADSKAIINNIVLCNTHASTTTVVTVYAVPSAGTAGDSNTIIKVPLAPQEVYTFECKLVLEEDMTIEAVADDNDIVCATISGAELTAA